jgi:hypothetical protein
MNRSKCQHLYFEECGHFGVGLFIYAVPSAEVRPTDREIIRMTGSVERRSNLIQHALVRLRRTTENPNHASR